MVVMEQTCKKYVPVLKLGFMEELVLQGYHVAKVVDNSKNPSQKVFMFYHKDGIEEALNKLTNRK